MIGEMVRDISEISKECVKARYRACAGHDAEGGSSVDI